MIMMWLGFWLHNWLGGSMSTWWDFPFFVTFFLLVCAECFSYVLAKVIWDDKQRDRAK